jgi:hypothetical protein
VSTIVSPYAKTSGIRERGGSAILAGLASRLDRIPLGAVEDTAMRTIGLMRNDIRKVSEAILLVVFSAGARVQAQDAPPDFFPLSPGSECVYKTCVDFGFGEIVCALYHWVVRVVERDGERLVLEAEIVLSTGESGGCDQAGACRKLIRARGNSVDIHQDSASRVLDCYSPLPPADEEGFLPHYRFDQDVFQHADSNECDNSRTIAVVGRECRVETFFAGVFEPCLHLEYPRPHCCKTSRREEWWCAGVGLVRWRDGSGDWMLAEIRRPFPRGDADGNRRLEITDAIAILNFLFLGTFSPNCEDALDSDDSGEVLITDAIALLGHLFLGAPQGLPPPFGDCGADPTPDSLPACGYEGPCEGV